MMIRRFLLSGWTLQFSRLLAAGGLAVLLAACAGLLQAQVAAAATSTVTVTTLTDGGAGSLRDLINAANIAGTPTTIVFTPGLNGAIVLTSTLPAINNDITISIMSKWISEIFTRLCKMYSWR